MSLTAQFGLAAVFFAGVAIALWFIAGNYNSHAEKKKMLSFGFVGFLAAGIAASLLIAMAVSLNGNIRESHQNCIDRGGFIYNHECVDRIPVQLQRL